LRVALALARGAAARGATTTRAEATADIVMGLLSCATEKNGMVRMNECK
jgi:hypothetical protein